MNLFFVTCLWPLVACIIEGGLCNALSFFIVANNTLTEVHSQFPLTVNISNLPTIRQVDKNAFDHVPDVESLILANNSIVSLPEFVFSNLTKLKYLSLSGNQISASRNLFVGLKNLLLLDISRNDISFLQGGSQLFNLSKSARILVGGNKLSIISTNAFTNPADDKTYDYEDQEFEHSYYHDYFDIVMHNSVELFLEDENTSNEWILMRICKHNGIVTSLEIHDIGNTPRFGCRYLSTYTPRVNLAFLNIKGFRKGWYRLPRDLPIRMLDLTGNEITEIGKEILNDLPANLVYVRFQDNKIRKISKDVIENEHLKMLDFQSNSIEEIEDGAFEKTKLSLLDFSENFLKSLNFVSTLPNTLAVLEVNKNRISSIPDGVFSNFSNLVRLHLLKNEIETLESNIFQDLKSLQLLDLSENKITTIEPDAFEGLTSLRVLDLHQNSISDLGNDTFAKLSALKELNLAFNRITKADTVTDLPKSVESLCLDNNEIEILEEGSFVHAPRRLLSLKENKISRIMRGAFYLPTLLALYLDDNNLTTINGDSYEGLSQLRRLSLVMNKISEIRKGACKNLASLSELNISYNPLEKLENGALYGLRIGNNIDVLIIGNNLKEIHGGVFDDV